MNKTSTLTPLQKERRERILKTAARHFSEVHFHEAELDRIARDAGVGKGTLYRYFENKIDLYLKTIEHQLQLALVYIQERARRHDDPVVYIETVIESAVDFFYKHPQSFNIVLLSNTVHFDEVVELVAGIRSQYYEHMKTIFEQAIADGLFREMNIDVAVRILDSAILHLMYEYHKNKLVTPEAIKTNLKTTLLNGFLK